MSAQQISITGTVSDASGEPLLGVSVTVPGTKTGTTTDFDGVYTINADKNGKLQFSYIGYKAQEVAVGGRNVIDIVMEENSAVLDEVVVIGYGTMDKKELTSAISHVSEKDFLTVSSPDPKMLIPGVLSMAFGGV
ncbi:MAG: carboxypeptidase-like regulatory domain-containing protein, partial [Muribaculaceae bacterium]|nr:carboxypeptidase-like regulatory domain-containing protein [Muribaculaceae bacterium]